MLFVVNENSQQFSIFIYLCVPNTISYIGLRRQIYWNLL